MCPVCCCCKLIQRSLINWNALVLVNINLWIMWVGESGAIVLNQMKKKKKGQKHRVLLSCMNHYKIIKMMWRYSELSLPFFKGLFLFIVVVQYNL